ncbi:ABC transporter ATP-binding protein [Pseudalkalibacillus berkeleyi]|uniref:ABC transporter ATP-binding protein n=1 Tax=Pseudalkalibacillus berkeleyi TaxID=1069813 RepID=A0ABS9H6B1_9BACL|nr:ABC transporter ATP-binding protein [Pseudalkalibacillus berkeleyi]MCF6139413.1 ABC transporter ATP-binding protein [Pseudalkalibacillus berkeleyi]
MIELRDVSYGYKSDLVLDKINFEEEDPIITCLWGRNGAGKTTLMKLLAGLNQPQSGDISVMGMAPYNNQEARRNICFIQENQPFNPDWKVRDTIEIAKGFHPNWRKETEEQLLKLFKLPLNKKIKALSKGMKTSLQLVIGLASHAQVTILDEPTNGLDAVVRKQLFKVMLESYENHPRHILLSTHHINEIQPLCESIAVIHNHKILFHQSIDDLRSRGILLTGDQKVINELTENMNILEKENLGHMCRVMIDDLYTEEWKRTSNKYNVTIEKADLQDYLINITNDTEEVLA